MCTFWRCIYSIKNKTNKNRLSSGFNINGKSDLIAVLLLSKPVCSFKNYFFLYCDLSRLTHDVGGQIAMYMY